MWLHRDVGGFYEGQYSDITLNDGSSKRVFVLVPINNKRAKNKTFDSWQKAKKVGWKKYRVTENY